MQITELSPTRFDLPGRADPSTSPPSSGHWSHRLRGEDPPELGRSWAIKPKFVVNGNWSCAELAIVHHLRDQGWHGVRAVGRSRALPCESKIVLARVA